MVEDPAASPRSQPKNRAARLALGASVGGVALSWLLTVLGAPDQVSIPVGVLLAGPVAFAFGVVGWRVAARSGGTGRGSAGVGIAVGTVFTLVLLGLVLVALAVALRG